LKEVGKKKEKGWRRKKRRDWRWEGGPAVE